VAEERSVVALSARRGRPVRMTHQIASIARRAGTGGRPPLGRGGRGGRGGRAGSNGSGTAHNRSGKRHGPMLGTPLLTTPG
jgi:hypothetical protein